MCVCVCVCGAGVCGTEPGTCFYIFWFGLVLVVLGFELSLTLRQALEPNLTPSRVLYVF
jgi:hypothetical protein